MKSGNGAIFRHVLTPVNVLGAHQAQSKSAATAALECDVCSTTNKTQNAPTNPMPAFDQLTLDTPRLHLRPLLPDDAPALFAIHSDARVVRYWSSCPWPSINEAHAMIAKDVVALPAGEHLRLALALRATGNVIGTCSLFHLSAQCRRAEIGYAMAHAHWGHGLMHEALIALLHYGFTTLDLNRVEADVDPRNTPSVRSLERLGFLKEGRLRERWIVEGEVSDTDLYGLLRRDWQSAAPDYRA